MRYSLVYFLSFVYVIIPILDTFFAFDIKNPTKEEEKKMMRQFRFKLPVYICLILDWVATFYLIKVLNTEGSKTSILNIIISLVSVGFMAGSNINIAHELSHKIESGVNFDYILGMLTLSKNLYIYWGTEHIFGHHKNVATPIDPATAKLNQTFYQFLPQTLIGTFKSSWQIECEHLKKKHPEVKSVFHYKNKFLWYMANNILLPLLVWKIFGFAGCIQFLVIAWVSVLMLEIVNYVEHYGLLRKQNEDGTYEKVNIYHSWNAPHRLSNYLLFKVQRHSDHHENSTKPYQILKSFEQSPTLPNGYV